MVYNNTGWIIQPNQCIFSELPIYQNQKKFTIVEGEKRDERDESDESEGRGGDGRGGEGRGRGKSGQ